MWEIVLGVYGAAVLAVVGWLFNRAINRCDKLADEFTDHEKQCNKRWDAITTTLAVHGEKLSKLENGHTSLGAGQASIHDKLDRILEALPAQS